MAPEPLSTEAQAAAAGLATPTNLDLLAQGDDAILRNARFTKDALDKAAAAQTEAAEAEALAASRADPQDALQPAQDDTVIFGVVDEDGRRTWLEAGEDGGPTPRSAELMAPAVAPAAAAAVGVADQSPAVTGLAFAVVDEDGRRTWLEAGEDGRPTDRVLEMLADGMQVGEVGTATEYRPTYSTAAASVVSGPDIVCWGDSMTAGAGGNGTSYPSVLANLSGRTVHNRGVGGETSVTITMRAGARPLLAIPQGGAIPASGPVVLDVRPIAGTDARQPFPLKQGSASWPAGTFAGVPGSISRTTAADGTTDIYSFTRSTAGAAVTVNRPTPFLSYDAAARRGDIAVIWIGQNGPSHARAKADVAAIVGYLNALDKRFLVISRPTSTEAEDTEWTDLYGRRFLSIRKYLVEYGLADAGITPTATDETDMAAGRVPTSLRVDSVHFNADGYTILANQLNNRLRELGWL